ncbi:transposase, partial [Fictibacillus fluitans]
MRNLTITTENYTTQTSLPLGGIQESSSTKQKSAPTFKPYDNQQVQMIFDLQEWIPDHHVARVIDEMVEAVPDDRLFSYYSGGGRSSYHPKMMIKVLLYGYSQKVYSCRGIEKLLQENLPAMWLAAMQKPDFRTLNDFRGQRMKVLMDELFETMIWKLIEDEYITMDHYFLDGTKIEADANKYSFVWKKSTMKHEAKLKENIQETLHHINRLTEFEALPEGEETSDELSLPLEEAATILDEEITSLTSAIEKETDTEKRKEMRKKRRIYKKPLKRIRQDFLPRLAKYKEQNELFEDRNSYSKTD